MERLTESLVATISNGLSLRDALYASYVCRGWNSVLSGYLSHTYSLHKYLFSSFPNPESILQRFRDCGAILSGSRALSYFLPSQREYTQFSDWDIYVPYPHYPLLHDELVLQGFQSVERTKPSPNPELFRVFDYRNNLSNDKIQLVAL